MTNGGHLVNTTPVAERHDRTQDVRPLSMRWARGLPGSAELRRDPGPAGTTRGDLGLTEEIEQGEVGAAADGAERGFQSRLLARELDDGG